jgi:hypothetical protein
MNRKTQITIETHSITIIRTSREPFSVHCGTCQKKVSAFTFGEIANALRLSTDEIKAMRQSGEIHVVASNNKLLCGNSFAALLKERAEKIQNQIN